MEWGGLAVQTGFSVKKCTVASLKHAVIHCVLSYRLPTEQLLESFRDLLVIACLSLPWLDSTHNYRVAKTLNGC